MARSLALVILALAIIRLGLVFVEPFGQRFLANDLNGYVAGARRFLETGSPYLPEQLSGTWQLLPDSFIHPPVALILFLPFIYIPAVVWWVIPIGLTIWSVIRLRPASWSWPVMAACLLWPRTSGILIAGNSDLWVAAALGVALAFALPTAVLLVMKPSYLPLVLVGAQRSNWRMAAIVTAIACLLFMNLWFDYLTVLRGVNLEPLYSLYNVPYVLIPLIAWVARAAGQTGQIAGTSAESQVPARGDRP